MNLLFRIALATLACASATAAVQVQPIWSMPITEEIPYDTRYGRAEQTLLADGSAFMVASESNRLGLAGTLRLTATGSFARGQLGHQPQNSGELRPEAVLAKGGSGVLVSMTETGNPRPIVVMLNSNGLVQWAKPRFASQARFLDGGDVLVLSDNELMRLRGSDGELIWLTNLLELVPNPVDVDVRLPQVMVGSSAQMLLFFRHDNSSGNPIYKDPLWATLDIAAGAFQILNAPTQGSALWTEACAPVQLGPDNVHVFFDHTGTQFDAIVERRSSSAALLWSTRLANVNFNNGARHCELAVTSELIALSSRSSETTLAALSHDGALKWRTTLNSDLPSELRASVTGLLVASQQQTKNGLLTVLERRRAIDGNVDWSATIPGRAVDLQHIGGEVHVSWATEGDTTELHLQRRNAASGALVAEHVARAQGFAMRPADMRIIEGFPVSLLAGLGAERRSTKIERLNPATGEPLWTSELELEETPGEVLQAAVFPGSAGRILALVYYTSADGLLHRQSLLALNADTGSLIWQSAMQRPLTQGTFPIAAQVRALADGSVYITSRSCDNPPVCSNALPIVSRLSAATGQRIWFAAAEGFTGVRGLDLLVGNFASTLVMLSAANGSELWRQTMPANSFVLETLSATAGDLFVLRQFSLNGQRAQLDRRFGGSGVLQWTVDPGAAGDQVRGPTLMQLADGDLLLSARSLGPVQPGVSRPLLSRIDGVTGAIEWLNNPTVANDQWLTVRPLEGATATHQWARSLRFVGDSFVNVEERYGLTTIALSDGAIGADHQYGQNYDRPLGSPVLGSGSIGAVRADGTSLVLNRSVNRRGLNELTLQLWPAPGADRGDVVLRRIQNDRPIRALGSSTVIEVEIEGAAAVAVSDITVGFASNQDGLKARLKSCQVTLGSGICPAQLGSSFEQTVSVGAGARMRLSYEVLDPDFRPKQARMGLGARGLFYLNTPFAFGDSNLGNNIAVVQVALGGMSNGFE